MKGGKMANLRDEVKELRELLKPVEEVKKVKPFKLPRRARVSRSQAKKNWVGVLKLNENRSIEPSKAQIEEQTIMLDGIPRLASSEYIFHIGKHPVIIQPSWSVTPFSPTNSFEESLNNGSNAKGYKLLMNKMKLATVENKKQLGGWWKWILGIGLLGLIAYAFLSGGVK